MKKKIVMLLLATALTATMVTACQQKPKKEPVKQEVEEKEPEKQKADEVQEIDDTKIIDEMKQTKEKYRPIKTDTGIAAYDKTYGDVADENIFVMPEDISSMSFNGITEMEKTEETAKLKSGDTIVGCIENAFTITKKMDEEYAFKVKDADLEKVIVDGNWAEDVYIVTKDQFGSNMKTNGKLKSLNPSEETKKIWECFQEGMTIVIPNDDEYEIADDVEETDDGNISYVNSEILNKFISDFQE